MKILWHSVHPLIPTGYGQQTRLFTQALKQAGHEVNISALAGQMGHVAMIDGIRVFPHSNQTNMYGMDTVVEHAVHLKPDVVWSFTDSFILKPGVVGALPWAAWTPADSDPLLPLNIPPLSKSRWLVACSKFGHGVIQKAFPDRPVAYVPCAYDPAVYRIMPLEEAYKIVQNVIGVDLRGVQVVNMVSANSGARKNFWAAFQAWAKVKTKFPNAKLVIHAERTGYFGEGQDLIAMMRLVGLEEERDVLFSPHWLTITGQLPPLYLAALHNISVCHLNTCFGEGFGLPLVEAQACGCPVVVPGFGAAQELLGPHSSAVREGTYVMSVPGALQYSVNADAVERVLLDYLYNDGGGDRREETAKFAAPYQIGNVMRDHMLPALETMAREAKDEQKKKKGRTHLW